MPHEIGQKVHQVVHVITGTVKDVQYIAADKSFSYLIEYEGADGNAHTRWFSESEIEAEVTP